MLPEFSKTIDDIPIEQEVGGRYVCWIVGLMVFLLCLVLIGATSLSMSFNQWNLGESGRLTVELPLHDVQNPELILENVLTTIQKTPHVSRVQVVENQEILKLLQPWAGQVNLLENLTLPALIDVYAKQNAVINVEHLATALKEFSSNIHIEEHSHWQIMCEKLRFSLEVIAYLFISLIGATVIITITLVTRSSLSTHASIIHVLQLVGARNRYIAQKFQKRAFWLAFKGGLWGIIMALPTIFFLNWLSLHLGVSDVLKPTLSLSLFMMILTLPLIVGGISFVTARFSVFKALRHLG